MYKRQELARAQQAQGRASVQDALAEPRDLGEVRLVAARVPADDRDALMQLGDHARDRIGRAGVVVLGAAWGGKATLLVTLTPDLVEAGRLHAGNLVKELAAAVGGRGGGRPGTAQAGLPDESALDRALAQAPDIVTASLG